LFQKYATTSDPTTPKGSFVTEQTLASFLGATAVTTIAWKLLAAIYPNTFGSRLNVVWIALIVGVAVTYLSWPEEEGTKTLVPINSRAGISAIIIGFFNALILAAAAMGIEVAAVPT
jgi:hypothetical protein